MTVMNQLYFDHDLTLWKKGEDEGCEISYFSYRKLDKKKSLSVACDISTDELDWKAVSRPSSTSEIQPKSIQNYTKFQILLQLQIAAKSSIKNCIKNFNYT